MKNLKDEQQHNKNVLYKKVQERKNEDVDLIKLAMDEAFMYSSVGLFFFVKALIEKIVSQAKESMKNIYEDYDGGELKDNTSPQRVINECHNMLKLATTLKTIDLMADFHKDLVIVQVEYPCEDKENLDGLVVGIEAATAVSKQILLEMLTVLQGTLRDKMEDAYKNGEDTGYIEDAIEQIILDIINL